MKKVVQQGKNLSLQNFARLLYIFEKNNWPIESVFQINPFDNFCNMLSTLESEECDLILELTEHFLWIRDNEYIKKFNDSFNKFINSHDLDNKKNLIICPLLPEKDFLCSKSSVALLYYIKANISELQNEYPNFKISFIESPQAINETRIDKKFLICLIDDFIGTGNTVLEATEYFFDREYTINDIAIIALVAMKDGIVTLKEKGYHVYADSICSKAITDTPNERKWKRIMTTLENKIKVKSKYHFGYGQSEALVKMIRTPNNTFPIYWLYNNKNKFAPFPRSR